MSIFRWLMKHPLIILAVYLLAIVAILFSMTGGGSSDKSSEGAVNTEKTDSSEVDLSQAPEIEPSTLTSALVEGKPTETEEETSTATESTTENASESGSEEKTAETKVAETNESESKNTESEATTTNQDSAASYFKEHGVDPSLNAPATVASTEEKQDSASEETNQDETSSATETTDATKAAAVDTDTQFDEMSTDEMLLMAREAYWNNGLEESAQLYQQLISSNPDVIDYKGELGNVYWRQGLPEKAAELYAEISLPMIEQGNQDRVANMVGFIGLFYPEKATEIHNKLQESGK